MKSLRDLLAVVLVELGQRCGTSTSMDVSYIHRRVETEGVAFLSITLGSYAESFERSLARGYVETHDFAGFNRQRRGCLPKFLSGFTSLVFDFSGRILDQPSIEAIKAIRQICRFAKKVSLPCSKERVKKAFDGYVEVEQELALWSPSNVNEALWNLFHNVSDCIWSDVNVEIHSIRHGTGAVSDRVKMPDKYTTSYWYNRLEPLFPAADLAFRSVTGWLDREGTVEFLAPEQEHPVRVITVPKTLKGPRIIGMEPVVTQLCQQGILYPLVSAIESNPLTRNSVRFTDQSHNARLALQGSKTGNLATLDLKEASDRVHKDVVYAMLRRSPIREAIFASRTSTSVLPDGRYCPLWKFASMGSAMCFPIESMVFFTIILASFHKADTRRVTRASILRYSRDISIYGDDIIVPVDRVPIVLDALQQFCLKVNTAKSFWTGKFRESCGMDAFDGIPVTPVYLNEMLPTKRSDTDAIASTVSLIHKLYAHDLFDSALYVHNHLESIGLYLNYGHESSAFLSSPFARKGKKRMCPDLHRPMVKALIIKDTTTQTELSDWERFARWVDLRSRSEIAVDPSEVPGGFPSAALKREWTYEV